MLLSPDVIHQVTLPGSAQRKANAFRLETLLKLSQAKAFDKKTTVLDYVFLSFVETMISCLDSLMTCQQSSWQVRSIGSSAWQILMKLKASWRINISSH
jgi:hypothetical protein